MDLQASNEEGDLPSSGRIPKGRPPLKIEEGGDLSEFDRVAAPRLPQLQWGRHFEMHPVVFPAGAAIILGLLLLAFFYPQAELERFFTYCREWVGDRFGWMYIGSMSIFLGFCIWLALGRFGRVRLGAEGEQPEFGRTAWFAMLFSAGMGIGLLFWSVAEPISHYSVRPPGVADGLSSARVAMAVTIFHWGLHPWALYALVGLSLAYFGFRRGMPLGFRSLLEPILGQRVWGGWGDTIDTLTVIATLCGVATSLGLGAQQVNAGLAYLWGWPISIGVQMGLIAGITAIATISVVLGLGTGIRRLSELNMFLALILLVIVIVGGGLIAFLGAMLENTGAYMRLLPRNSFRAGAYGVESRSWLNGWTVFFWAWWISWSPFVGMFIARVSRGRTIREFVVGVLLAPTLMGMVWLTAFGSATLRQHVEHQGLVATDPRYVPQDVLPTFYVSAEITEDKPRQDDSPPIDAERRALTAVEYYNAPAIISGPSGRPVDQLSTVLFVLFDGLFHGSVWGAIAAGVATLCIVLFFVTSSDSASLVIDMIASGGNPDPPVGTRLFWAITEGLVAGGLLYAGGLKALQAAAIVTALPLCLILLVACIALYRSLVQHESGGSIRRAA